MIDRRARRPRYRFARAPRDRDPGGGSRCRRRRARRGVEDWRTLKLFGARSRQDDLLALLLPAIRAGQHAGEIDRWFFQRYIDGPGSRHHLRVRVHARRRRCAHRVRHLRKPAARSARRRARRRDADRRRDRRIPSRAGTVPGRRAAPRSTTCSNPTASSRARSAAAARPPRPHLPVRAGVATGWPPGLGLDLDARHALAKEGGAGTARCRRICSTTIARAPTRRFVPPAACCARRCWPTRVRSWLAIDPHAAALAAHRARVAHAARDVSPRRARAPAADAAAPVRRALPGCRTPTASGWPTRSGNGRWRGRRRPGGRRTRACVIMIGLLVSLLAVVGDATAGDAAVAAVPGHLGHHPGLQQRRVARRLRRLRAGLRPRAVEGDEGGAAQGRAADGVRLLSANPSWPPPTGGSWVMTNGAARDWPAYQKGRDLRPGNYVVIEHAPGEYTEFRHLAADSVTGRRRRARLARAGDRQVRQLGQRPTMPHLHMGFLRSANPISTRPMFLDDYERRRPRRGCGTRATASQGRAISCARPRRRGERAHPSHD